MENELNTLVYDNTKITFTGNTDNTATSDELTAAPLYQDKMGTNYSKGKAVVRAFNLTGISLILTAAAIKTGSLIANAYVLNPPSVENVKYQVKDHTFDASFKITNVGEYSIYYYLYINDKNVMLVDCSEAKEYTVNYSGLKTHDRGHFYIEFSNNVDYKKTIENYTFTVED